MRKEEARKEEVWKNILPQIMPTCERLAYAFIQAWGKKPGISPYLKETIGKSVQELQSPFQVLDLIKRQASRGQRAVWMSPYQGSILSEAFLRELESLKGDFDTALYLRKRWIGLFCDYCLYALTK